MQEKCDVCLVSALASWHLHVVLGQLLNFHDVLCAETLNIPCQYLMLFELKSDTAVSLWSHLYEAAVLPFPSISL